MYVVDSMSVQSRVPAGNLLDLNGQADACIINHDKRHQIVSIVCNSRHY